MCQQFMSNEALRVVCVDMTSILEAQHGPESRPKLNLSLIGFHFYSQIDFWPGMDTARR